MRTYRYFPAAQLGLPADCLDYAPVPYRMLWAMLRSVPPELRSGTLLDLGCGLGRVLVCAQSIGFRKCIGVELSAELAEDARRQMRRYRNCEIVTGDASRFEIRPEVSVVVLANPFRGEVLRSTLRNIANSIGSAPRQHRILGYYNILAIESTCREIGVELRQHAYHSQGGYAWASYEVTGVLS